MKYLLDTNVISDFVRGERKLGPVLEAMFDALCVLPFTGEDARAAGRVRAGLRKAGRPIGPYDVMLAGCALARGLVLVTANVAEFDRVASLVTENWRATG